jgi:two-component system chemotaxis sensor kinase CheA
VLSTAGDESKILITSPQQVRVGIERLDALMGLFEEMLMLRLKLDAMLEPAIEVVRGLTDPGLKQRLFFVNEFRSIFAEMARLLSENQDALLAIRLVPLEQIFGQYPRMVRDLALREKKKIEFIINGGDIELDRTVIDGLGGALAHLLRNAVDHGIVNEGTITLSAFREKGRARIIVEDNGSGIDYARVREVAALRGIEKREKIAAMDDGMVAELLFHPNMSTNTTVTDISGRGVGLFAVRSFTQDIGGRVEVLSPVTAGSGGTRFTLDLPISLATLRVLIVESYGSTFAIPFENIEQTLQFTHEAVSVAAHQETLSVGDRIIPLIHLENILGLVVAGMERRVSENDLRTAVILREGKSTVALEVNHCSGEQELLVKSLPPIFRSIKGFSGSTLLPDGRTILLLDSHGLLFHAISDILKNT